MEWVFFLEFLVCSISHIWPCHSTCIILVLCIMDCVHITTQKAVNTMVAAAHRLLQTALLPHHDMVLDDFLPNIIDNRSRNKRRNLWVGRCVSSWWPWFPSRSSVLIYMYTYVYIPYTSSVIGRIYNGSVIQYWRSCTPLHSIGECAVPGLNAILCFLWFTNCVLLFDNYLILGCLWHWVFV